MLLENLMEMEQEAHNQEDEILQNIDMMDLAIN